MRFQSTVLFVADMERAKEFYQRFLGQEIALDIGVNVGFTSGIALWQADYAKDLLFGSSDSGMPAQGHPTMELYFETDEIDAVAARLHESGVCFLHPLQEQPWGQRTIRFYDPDGHLIEAGEPMWVVVRRYAAAGFSPEQIAQKTTLPAGLIVRMLSGCIGG
jgi:catechol 2,3-dioxygenase-like lactoylglutathione lyase family enzyme